MGAYLCDESSNGSRQRRLVSGSDGADEIVCLFRREIAPGVSTKIQLVAFVEEPHRRECLVRILWEKEEGGKQDDELREL